MSFSRIFLTIAFVLTNLLTANYIFKGIVVNIKGQPIRNVNISLNNNEYGTKTDNVGAFLFSELTDSLYEIKASHIGYQDITQRVNVRLSKTFNIVLEEDVIDFDQIVVTGTRNNRHIKDAPILTHVISNDDIKYSSYLDVKGIMQTVLPNLQTVASNHVGDRVKMQGIDNKYMLFLIDGDRVSGEYAGNIDFSMLNIQNVEKIEIIENSMSTIYGSGSVAGVVNIITKLNKERYWSNVSYLEDEFLTKNQYFNIGTSNGKIYYDGSYLIKDSEGFDLDNELPNTFKESNSEISEHRFLLKGKSYLTELSHKNYNSSINQYKIEFNSNVGDYGGNQVQYDPPLKRYSDKTNKIKIKYDLNESNHLKISFLNEEYIKYNYYPYYYQGWSEINGLKENGKEFKNAFLNHRDLQFSYVKVFDKYEILIGSDYSIDEYTSYNIYKANGELEQPSIFDGVTQTKDYKQYGWYIHNQIKYTNDREISFAIRQVKGPNYKKKHIYSLSQMFKYSSGYTSRITFSSGFRLPSLKELYYEYPSHSFVPLYGNPDLLPTKNKTYSFSLDKRTRLNDFSINFYINNVNNYISTEYTNDGSLIFRNYDSVLINGLNLHFKRIISNKHTIKLVYNFTDMNSESFEVLELVSKHAMNVQLRCQILKNLHINIDTKYLSEKFNFDQEVDYKNKAGWPYENPIKILEAYSITNVLFFLKVKKYINIKFGLKNIFNYKDPLRFEGDSILGSYDPGKRYYFQININYKGGVLL